MTQQLCSRCRYLPASACVVVFRYHGCPDNACPCVGGLRVRHPTGTVDYCARHAPWGRAVSYETTKDELMELLMEATRYTWAPLHDVPWWWWGPFRCLCGAARRRRRQRRGMLHAIAQLRSCMPGKKEQNQHFRVPLDLFLECRVWALAYRLQEKKARIMG